MAFDFPSQILDAINQNRLVVFAGAGVSMGEPAALPSFWKLATEIAAGTGETPKKLGTDGDGNDICEPLDQFLGRLSLDDSAVHKRAAKLINQDGASHTELHTSLVLLFGAADCVRVVTTNFDLLFESAAKDLWGIEPPVFNAPALPLGSEIEGIVHLHGSVSNLKHIVLTDADFGRAYLTQGWARRFLVELFEHFTVLFVGYSHDDTVMQYLARALPSKALGKRFAMTDLAGKPERWRLLGIEPIIFPKDNGNDYTSLYSSASQLADFANRPHTEWQEKVGRVATNPPPGDIEAEDVIRHALTELPKTRYFTQTAESPDWIFWLDSEGKLSSLFTEDNPDEITCELGNWLINRFSESEADRLFFLIGKHRHQIGAWFWWSLARSIGNSEEDKDFICWLDILLQIRPGFVDVHALQWLAEKSHKLGLISHALRVFTVMAEPKIVLREPYRFEMSNEEEYRVRSELNINSPHWNLNEVWQNCLRPNIDELAHEILNVCSQLILQRNDLARSWGVAGEGWDWDSTRRSAIDPHEQDDYEESIDVAINACRDAIERIATDSPDIARLWCLNHSTSRSFLLRRISIHGIGLLSDTDDDKKINILLDLGLHDSEYRHESFKLLSKTYLQAKTETRKNLIEAILSYVSIDEEDPKRQSAYEHMQWFSWLLKSDPNCVLVKKQIEAITSTFEDLEVRRYPDLTSWVEDSSRNDESPWSVEDLLSKDNAEWFSEIVTFNTEEYRGPNRTGLLRAITDATNQNSGWGIKLANYLRVSELWNSDIWGSLLRGLTIWPGELVESRSLLDIIREKTLQSNYPREIVDILQSAVNAGGISYICDILSLLNELAQHLWSVIPESENPIIDSKDWLTSAINTTEGRLAEYWIHSLSVYTKCTTSELVDPYHSVLSRMCSIEDEKTNFTISAITRQLPFLASLNEKWVEENITPLFITQNIPRLQQAWHGFLGCGGPTKPVFNRLENAFTNLATQLDEVIPDHKRRFIDFYTAATFWHVENPNQQWIPRLLNSISKRDYLLFSNSIEDFIRHSKPDSRQSAWQNWLKTYWENRIAGAPQQLLEDEIRSMLEWTPHLVEQFPDAVNLALQMPQPNLEHEHIINKLQQTEIPDQYPNDVAKLVTYLLGCPAQPHCFYNLEALLDRVSAIGIGEDEKITLNEALVASGRGPIS